VCRGLEHPKGLVGISGKNSKKNSNLFFGFFEFPYFWIFELFFTLISNHPYSHVKVHTCGQTPS
jgi:hypothetical protein